MKGDMTLVGIVCTGGKPPVQKKAMNASEPWFLHSENP